MRSRRLILKTIVTRSFGTLIHILFGFLAVYFSREWLFTLIFLFKQSLDVLNGEDPAVTSGDIASYALGLIIGLVWRQISWMI